MVRSAILDIGVATQAREVASCQRCDLVLEELVRIDLEHHWVRARPRWLEDYLQRFPQLLEASASVRTTASSSLTMASTRGRERRMSR